MSYVLLLCKYKCMYKCIIKCNYIFVMTDIFGDILDQEGRSHCTAQIVEIAQGNSVISEQVEKNTKDQALQGDLPDELKNGVVKAMMSHNDLARVLLKDPQSMAQYVSLVYDIMKKDGMGSLVTSL